MKYFTYIILSIFLIPILAKADYPAPTRYFGNDNLLYDGGTPDEAGNLYFQALKKSNPDFVTYQSAVSTSNGTYQAHACTASNYCSAFNITSGQRCPDGSFTATCTGTAPIPPKDCTNKQGTVFSDNATIDMGTHELTTASQVKNCDAGCEVMPIDYSRSNQDYSAKWWSKLIQGTTHYLVSGVISYTGKSCDASQTSAPTDLAITDTCASGDIYIKVAGKSACVTAPSTVKSVAPTITQSPIGSNPKTIQSTTNPVDPSAPSQTTVSTYTYDSSGAVSVTSNSINTVNNTYGQNPTDGQTTDMSGVESKLDAINKSLKTTGTVDGKSNGSNTANNSFYTSKYPNGLTDVMSTASSNLSNSSIGKLTNDLTPNLGDGGTAPSWTWNFNLGKYMNFGSYTLTTDSDLWAILSIIFIITSLFVARRLVFGG